MRTTLILVPVVLAIFAAKDSQPRTSLYGRVTDVCPAADASVSLINVFGGELVAQTRSDSRGRFSFQPWNGSSYVVIAALLGYAGDARLVSFESQDAVSVKLDLRKAPL